MKVSKNVCTLAMLLGFLFLMIFLKMLTSSEVENFEDSEITLENPDDRIRKIVESTDDHSYDNLVKLTHEWCANMRNSKSLSTACLPLQNKEKSKKMYFPISVCCSSCYCEIIKENSKFYFEYDENTKMYYLMKNKKVVQVLKGFTTIEKCKKHYESKKDLYYGLVTLDFIKNKLCSN